MKLYLCEKPSQAKDIAAHVGARTRVDGAYVGNDRGSEVVVTHGIGHLMELDYPDAYDPALKQWKLELLPFVPKSGAWRMSAKSATLKQFKIVQGYLKQASSIVIATDADREGEVIARELMDAANIDVQRVPTQRLWLSALDDASVRKGLANLLPGAKTLGMGQAGVGRAHADWAMGLNLTRALTVAFGASGGGSKNVLNCGRVQTPVMALVVRRERAITDFVSTPFYELVTVFDIADSHVTMSYAMPKSWKDDAAAFDGGGRLIRRALLDEVTAKVLKRTGRVTAVTKTNKTEAAPLPYSLSAIQQEANRRFGLNPAKVLDLCQSLYEKHKATSYPRTDCQYLPKSMLAEIPAVLDAVGGVSGEQDSGFAAVLAAARQHYPSLKSMPAFNDAKMTAHHAIIPTMRKGVDMNAMSVDERKVYDMIRRRYVAQLLGAYHYEQTDLTVVCEGETFTAKGAVPQSPGWKLCYPEQPKASTGSLSKSVPDADDGDSSGGDSGSSAKDMQVLPAVREGQQAHNVKAEVATRKTSPPKRYTEATLLAAMESIDKEIDDPRFKAVMKNKEKAGIGTDATRASIIEGLFTNQFIAKHASRKKDIVPTSKAQQLIAILEQVAPTVVDPVLTAVWEEYLSQVENNTMTLEQFEGFITIWINKVIADIKAKAGTIQVDEVAGSAKRAATSKPASAGTGRGAGQFVTKASTVAGATNQAVVKVANPATGTPHAAGQDCPKCKTKKLALVASRKYEGKYLLCCPSRECGHWEWPKG
jgi:DNA topoisomerase-3